MKKFLALTLAFSFMFAFSACGSNADETATTTVTMPAETTKVVSKPMAIKDVMVSDDVPEYWKAEDNLPELYQVVELDSPVNGYYGEVKFFYVPYADREGEMYPSYLKVEVMEKSEDFAITFTDREEAEGNVFPGNISEGFVYPNSQLTASSNYNAYKEGSSLTLNGFQPGLKTVDMVFRNAMPAMEIKVGEETYDVYCIQFIFE